MMMSILAIKSNSDFKKSSIFADFDFFAEFSMIIYDNLLILYMIFQ